MARGGVVALAVVAVWALAGCDEPAARCVGPAGVAGPCCTLVLPGGERVRGACLEGRCRRADQPGLAPACGGGEADARLVDARLVDAAGDGAVDAVVDASDDAGDAGGAGDGAVDGGPDAAVDRCAGVLCDPGERCDPATGACRSRQFGVPGGACAVDADCGAGRCLSEAASGGAIPGGFCSVACVDDGDCGRGACVAVADGRACFEPCDGRGECRAGWTCRPDAARSVCRIDCRVAGCPGQGRCDVATGVCGAPAFACRYDCGVGESCEEGRCVRVDGSCVTDYHCRLGVETCAGGRCVPVEFSACAGDDECGAGQRCAPVGEGGGCLFACASDADCPADRACRVDLGACVRPGCGGETGNGELLGACGFGAGGDRPGTCVPYAGEGSGGAPGFCVEAGLAAAGEPCDAQSRERSVAERAVQCGPGLICRGDPDDPLDPERRWAGRGACAALCLPGAGDGRCGGEGCVDFSEVDDPATAADEARTVGLCLPVECDVLDPAGCAPGARCRAYGLSDRAGVCGVAGVAPRGGACASDADCAEVALCVARGAGTECLRICDDDGECGGGRCYRDAGWRFGVCL
ncbi:MAG: hypothetical protein H6703_11595 [Myxococcales bacterium]|nr:hypothetical protein [Myxococcales bacterium]